MRFVKKQFILIVGIFFLLTLGGLFLINGSSKKTIPQKDSEFLVRASIPYWDQEKAVVSFKKNYKQINYLSLFWYYMDSDGKVEKYEYANEDKSIIDFAKKNNIKTSALITNLPEDGGWDSERVEDVIEDSTEMELHIAEISNLLKRMRFDGVTIDYESVDEGESENFTVFIKKLSERMHKEGKYVEVALHPKRGIENDDQYEFQNWSEISKYADRIYIMAYEEHWDGGEPGPIASTPWVEDIIDYTLDQDIDLSKLLFGIPLDGYDWDTDSDEDAEGLTFEEAMDLKNKKKAKIEFDQTQKSPMFRYDSHEVWFENSESFKEKIKLVRENNISGITLWRLGGEDPEIWDALKEFKF